MEKFRTFTLCCLAALLPTQTAFAASLNLITLPGGATIIQVVNAVAFATGGGLATADTRTAYYFAPDFGDPAINVHDFTGTTWPYIYSDGVLNIDPGITASITVANDGVGDFILINGNPLYQFINDVSPSDANGNFGPWNFILPDGSPTQSTVSDADGDGVNDNADNCPMIANPGQENLDGDAFGDVCDDDVDGDGLLNGVDSDDDNDGLSDIDEITAATDPFDPDTDNDGIVDGLDRSPLSVVNNFCFGMGTNVVFTLDLSTTLTCAVTGTITVQTTARVAGPGDLLLIAPKVTFDSSIQFRVDSTAKMTVIDKDPTAPIP